MNIVLERYQSNSEGTFGVLHFAGHKLVTVEKPWMNNKPFESCIPSGEYRLTPITSEKYGDVLCMINNNMGVTRYKIHNSKRYACLIHAANYARQVQGCIAVGQHHVDGMVTNSRKSLRAFHTVVSPHEEHTLTIRWGGK